MAEFNAEGSATALATVCTLATLTLVLPNFTESAPGPEFTSSQLAFAAIASIALYALFVFIQAIRHRDYFLPVEEDAAHEEPRRPADAAGPRRPASSCWWSRWSRSSGWRRSSRPRSRTRSTPSARRSRRSA